MTRVAAMCVIALATFASCIAGVVGDSHASAPACSRERSRRARAVLDDYFYPVVDRHAGSFEVPPACPFQRSKDMYLEQEKHKERVRRTQWKSLYSEKVFRTEWHVDKHMDNRHADKIPPGADVCLADYCAVLRCDEHHAHRNPDDPSRSGSRGAPSRSKGGGGGGAGARRARRERCDESKLAGARHFCETLMHACFPSDDDAESDGDRGGGARGHGAAGRLRAYFTRHHCDQLTCDAVAGMFQIMDGHHLNREGRRGAFVFVVVFCVVLAAYYVVAWRHAVGGRARGDLRRATARKGAWVNVDRITRSWPLCVVLGKRRKRKAY